MNWAKPPQSREQLVLFSQRLDDVIADDHVVRLLDLILGRVDWSRWEAAYVLTRGQPPIHPRVLASVILYGLLTRIRSSRALEDAINVRVDMMWLVEGRSIDHTTISEFRRKNTAGLKDLFVQIGLIAREMGCLPLETLAFDGTRIRAHNRKSGTRTQEEFRAMKAVLADRFDAVEERLVSVDAQEEVFADQSPSKHRQELANVQQRLEQVELALAEFERMEQAGQQIPKRLPVTDPQARLTPNKEGGFAPNYTPLATVDVDSGLIVADDVIAGTNESKHLMPALKEVENSFGLDAPPNEVLADALMATGDNLAACDEQKITLYSPLPGQATVNPAIREDPSQPVASADRDQLPTRKNTYKGVTWQQLDKQAFVYDADNDCYWCPEGKRLPFSQTTSETRHGRRNIRYRYQSNPEDCVACPLREVCMRAGVQRREVGHQQHESHLIQQRELMKTDAARQKYARRRHAGERPFAVIKQVFGVRQFLTRGLVGVRQEWRWLTTAFNLKLLIGLIHSGVDPP